MRMEADVSCRETFIIHFFSFFISLASSAFEAFLNPTSSAFADLLDEWRRFRYQRSRFVEAKREFL